MIVADAAPIIAFARLGRLALLQHIVEELVVPDAVYDDLVVKGRGKPGAAEVAESTWIRRESIRSREATAHFPPVLGAGEREAIVLAAEHHAVLLGERARHSSSATASRALMPYVASSEALRNLTRSGGTNINASMIWRGTFICCA